MAKEGDLRVWHIPQVPGNSFYVGVDSPEEAAKIMGVLADYDLFQLQERVKPDYSNAQGLQVFEDGEWVDWYSEDGEDIDEWMQCNVF